MSGPIAFLNGRFLPADEVAVPIWDAGFVQGVTVAEQLRTFRGELFCLNEHLARLFRSLEIIAVDPGMSRGRFADVAEELVRQNYSGDDLGLGIFVTPGPYAAMADGQSPGATVCLHTYPLRFKLWAQKYRRGEFVAISSVRQVPASCWPPELKCRSRMHYYLADREAARLHPGSRALLLDQDGMVSEATTANVVIHRADEGLVSPPQEKILPGISLKTLARLAREHGISFTHRDIRPEELLAAEEVMLTSTSVCVLPVTRCDGKAIGSGRPGPVYESLLSAWSGLAGIDIAAQATSA